MKLSELVRYRNNLDTITPHDVEIHVASSLVPVIHAVETNEMQMPNLLKQLTTDHSDVLNSIKNFKSTLDTIKHEVDNTIRSIESTYLANSYRLYQAMKDDTVEYTLNRRLSLTPSVSDYILGRIQAYSDWKNTGAILRPGLEDWIDLMVAFDPLYLIDTNYAMFDPVKTRFNDLYLNRLRFYTLDETDKPGMLNNLPDNQFGIILAYNFFHYKPFEILKNYLTEIYSKLDQGGTLLFTFNDCDRWGAVALTERNFMCYTPGRLIRGLCENLGYEIVNSYVIDNATTWLEIRKPGQHKSIKGGQTLARIIEKSK